MSKKSKKQKKTKPPPVENSPLSFWLIRDPVFYLILFGAFLIRFYFVQEPWRGDEAYTFLHFARRPFSFLLTDYHFPNNHIFHSILMRISYLTLGHGNLTLRFPVFIFGVGAVYFSYLFAKEAAQDKIVARVAALLAALSHWMLFYSTNARGYIIQAFMVLAMGLSLFLYREGKLNKSALIGIVLCGYLTLYAVPSGLVFVIPFILCLFIPSISKLRFPQAFTLSAVMIAVTFLSYIPVLDELKRKSGRKCPSHLQPMMESFINMSQGIAPWFVLLFFMILGFYAVRKNQPLFRFGLICIFFYPFLEVATYVVKPMPCMFPRSYFLNAPFVYIFSSLGLVFLYRWLTGPTVIKKGVRIILVLTTAVFLGKEMIYTVTHPAHLFNEKRELSQDCRVLTRQIAKSMQRADRILTFGMYSCEPAVLMEIPMIKNFPGIYGLHQMDRVPSRNIYFMGKSKEEIDRFMEEKIPRQYWSGPRFIGKEGSAVAYRISRVK